MKKVVVKTILATLLIACGKAEQAKETFISCTVEDITTGIMSEEASVTLLEIETPPRPFAPLVISNVKTYSVPYGYSFTDTFNAKKGDRYEYILQFEYSNEHFYSGLVSENESYGMIERCTLTKKSENECILKIEPTASIQMYADNPPDDASDSDSIWLELSDGNISRTISFRGLGSSSVTSGKFPHGFCRLNYKVFRAGTLDEEGEESFYLSHGQDTTIKVLF